MDRFAIRSFSLSTRYLYQCDCNYKSTYDHLILTVTDYICVCGHSFSASGLPVTCVCCVETGYLGYPIISGDNIFRHKNCRDPYVVQRCSEFILGEITKLYDNLRLLVPLFIHTDIIKHTDSMLLKNRPIYRL
jgi:hypothetical protein